MKRIEKQIGYGLVVMLTILVTILGIQVVEVFSNDGKSTTIVSAANISYTNEELTILADELEQHQEQTFNKMYPVGRIYISTSSTNPASIFGGTWVAYGSGKTLVGVDSSQTEFNVVEKTGGAKSVSHYHGSGASQNGSLSAAIGSTDASPAHIGFKAANYFGGFGNATYTLQFPGYGLNGGFNHFTQVWGTTASATVSTLQPYITVYMWKRTA